MEPQTSTQISLVDWVEQRRDAYVADWEAWRDEQRYSEEEKQLVDDCYMEVIAPLDKLLGLLVAF